MHDHFLSLSLCSSSSSLSCHLSFSLSSSLFVCRLFAVHSRAVLIHCSFRRKFSCESIHTQRKRALFILIVHFNNKFFSFPKGSPIYNNIFCVMPFYFGQKINGSAIVYARGERDRKERYQKKEREKGGERTRWEKKYWNWFYISTQIVWIPLKWTVRWQSDNFYREQRKITALFECDWIWTSWRNEKTNRKVIKTADECKNGENSMYKWQSIYGVAYRRAWYTLWINTIAGSCFNVHVLHIKFDDLSLSLSRSLRSNA